MNDLSRTRRARPQATPWPSVDGDDHGPSRAKIERALGRPTTQRPPGSRRQTREPNEAGSTSSARFTAFARRLATDRGPTDQDVASVLRTLRGALIGSLRRRNLWRHSPRYLGIIGHQRWTTPAPSTVLVLDDAVGELVTECYVYIFIQRLPRLLAQLAVRPNIDGLVFLNIQHFLHEKQRTCDPLGYRVLTVLRAALRSLHDADRLYLLDGPATINNNSILSFTPGGAATTARRLAPLVSAWSDRFAQPLAQTRASQLPAVTNQLSESIMTLHRHGVSGFKVGDVLRPLQIGIRERWATRAVEPVDRGFEQVDGVNVPVAITPPCRALERRAMFDDLIDTVADQIDRLDTKPKTRGYLQTLWAYLSAFAEDRPHPRQDKKHHATSMFATETLPSYRQLGTMLGIPRERLPNLFATLRHLIRCRAGHEHETPSNTVPLVESA